MLKFAKNFARPYPRAGPRDHRIAGCVGRVEARRAKTRKTYLSLRHNQPSYLRG